MKLTAKARKAIPTKSFAGPGRSFPIEDKSHARAALSMAHYAKNPAAIREKVHAKYPSLGKAKMTAHMGNSGRGGPGKFSGSQSHPQSHSAFEALGCKGKY